MGRKIASVAKAISIISKICRIFVIIGFVFMLALTALMFALPEDMIQLGIDAIIGYRLSPEIFGQIDGATSSSRINIVFDVADIAPYMVSALIEMIFSFFIFLLIGKIAEKMSDANAPFSGKAGGNIIALGVLLIVASVVPGIYTSIVTLIMSVKYGLGTRVSFNMNFDLSLVIYILGYILLYMLYKYGASLEAERAVSVAEDERINSASDEVAFKNSTTENMSEADARPDENNTENLS